MKAFKVGLSVDYENDHSVFYFRKRKNAKKYYKQLLKVYRDWDIYRPFIERIKFEDEK
jgi:hypothetical protein